LAALISTALKFLPKSGDFGVLPFELIVKSLQFDFKVFLCLSEIRLKFINVLSHPFHRLISPPLQILLIRNSKLYKSLLRRQSTSTLRSDCLLKLLVTEFRLRFPSRRAGATGDRLIGIGSDLSRL
jgi:hypothetical protein